MRDAAEENGLMAADKLDLHREHRDEYVATPTPTLLEIEPAQYLAIEGGEQPGSGPFERKLTALFSVAFTMRMASKVHGRDYSVGSLEALWWKDDEPKARLRNKRWRWQMLVRTPGFIGPAELAAAQRRLVEKAWGAEIHAVTLEKQEEGLCVQALHVGPYDHEAPTIDDMLAFARDHGLAPHGRHHEIYLSDPRRVAPEALRTILRLPVRGG